MGIFARHIQDFSGASALERHWGYVDRVLPCKNDALSCEYLDLVYHSHDLGVLYSAILWATILGLIALGVVFRLVRHATLKTMHRSPINTVHDQPATADSQESQISTLQRLYLSGASLFSQKFLPEVPWLQASRLQVAVLGILSGYLLIWSFIGISYKTWVTPVKGYSGLNQTRSSIGPFSDRIGILAYALTPLSVMLASRESILSLATGIPAQNFLFLHKWIGRIIFVQSLVHAVMWSVIEGVFYQPQPSVYNAWITQLYMIFGIVAMFLVTVLFVFSFKPVIRWTGYGVFRKVHYVTAVLYIAMCWGHWWQLSCWMIASSVIYGLDRGVRLLRLVEIHLGHRDGATLLGFRTLTAKASVFEDNKGYVIRLEIKDTRNLAWTPGQHFYLTFPQLSIWQSHPFTAVSILDEKFQYEDMAFVIRCETGETRKLLSWVQSEEHAEQDLSVIMAGPYGAFVDKRDYARNVVGVAGGTGITYTLPRLANVALHQPNIRQHLVWIISDVKALQWIERDLGLILQPPYSINVHVFVTRRISQSMTSKMESKEAKTEELSSSDLSSMSGRFPGIEVTYLADTHPDLRQVLLELEGELGNMSLSTKVIGSGPGGMLRDLRAAAAQCNHPARIWRDAEVRCKVVLDCDVRIA